MKIELIFRRYVTRQLSEEKHSAYAEFETVEVDVPEKFNTTNSIAGPWELLGYKKLLNESK